jgi:ABC-type branched-subunit amino acid transport system substrate-binding protein
MAELGDDANRVFFAQGAFDVASEEEQMARFVADYEARFGGKPDLYAAHGYDAILVLGQAAAESPSAIQFPSDILTGMRSISNFTGVTGNIQFRESGDVQKFARMFYDNEGTVVDYQQWEDDRQKAAAERIRDLQRRQEELNRKVDSVKN